MRYRRVSTAFWLDEKVRNVFDDDGRLGFLRLLTSPNMTSVGAMRATIASEAAEIGWSARRFQRAIRPAIDAGMLEINTRVGYIGLPNFLKHNPPESPNVAKAWATALASLPECAERETLIGRCWRELGKRKDAEAYRKAFSEAFAEAFGRRLPLTPSPIPEQEQETGAGAGAGGAPRAPMSGSKNNGKSHDEAWADVKVGEVRW